MSKQRVLLNAFLIIVIAVLGISTLQAAPPIVLPSADTFTIGGCWTKSDTSVHLDGPANYDFGKIWGKRNKLAAWVKLANISLSGGIGDASYEAKYKFIKAKLMDTDPVTVSLKQVQKLPACVPATATPAVSATPSAENTATTMPATATTVLSATPTLTASATPTVTATYTPTITTTPCTGQHVVKTQVQEYVVGGHTFVVHYDGWQACDSSWGPQTYLAVDAIAAAGENLIGAKIARCQDGETSNDTFGDWIYKPVTYPGGLIWTYPYAGSVSGTLYLQILWNGEDQGFVYNWNAIEGVPPYDQWYERHDCVNTPFPGWDSFPYLQAAGQVDKTLGLEMLLENWQHSGK